MSLENLNKDILMHLSQYIEETPEEWEIFKNAFDKNGEITDQKRKEVLNRKVWIEICVNFTWNQVCIHRLHLEKPDIGYIEEQNRLLKCMKIGCFKVIVIEKKLKDLVDRIIPENKVRYKLPSELQHR